MANTTEVKPITKNKRIPKRWTIDPASKVEKFNIDEINSKNLINHLLVAEPTDFTYSTIMRLLGSFKGKKLCNHYDYFDVPAGGYSYDVKVSEDKSRTKSNTGKFTTTIGIWIMNNLLIKRYGLCDIFGGYINDNINKKKFKKMNQTLIYELIEGRITTEQYKGYLNCTQFLMPLEDILSPGHTEAIITCTKYIEKKKQELIPKYKKDIEAGNVAAIERMEKELLDYAKALLKDDPALDLYESGGGGTFDNNFKNMYVMKGAIKDPDPNAKKQYNVALSNYADGISADEYSILCNALSAGPYQRGKKTEIGGYWEKLFVAAYQYLYLGEPGSDCGTKKYLTITLDESNIDRMMYNYIIKSDGKLEELTSKNKDKYLGKKVKMRFSLYCKQRNGFCNCCAGNFLYRRGDTRNVGLALVQLCSALKNISMKAFHDSTISTHEIDLMKAFSLK